MASRASGSWRPPGDGGGWAGVLEEDGAFGFSSGAAAISETAAGSSGAGGSGDVGAATDGTAAAAAGFADATDRRMGRCAINTAARAAAIATSARRRILIFILSAELVVRFHAGNLPRA